MLKRNFNIVQGKGKELLFTCLDDDGEIIDLTSTTSVLKVVLDNPEIENTTLICKSATLLCATSGTCKVNLSNDDTNIDSFQYTYNLITNFGADDDRVLFEGDFIVHGDDIDNRIKQIKTKYGLNYDYYIMKEALDYARVETLANGFENVINEKTSKSNIIKICRYIADANFDKSIDENEFKITQFMKNPPYTVEDITSHIISVNLDNPHITFIEMDAEYPSEGYVLRVEYKLGRKPFSEIKPFIDKLEEWYVIKYLFENLEPHKLQHGMTSKNINGIDVTYDAQGISDFQKKILNNITYYIMKCVPMNTCPFNNKGNSSIIGSVLIPKSYD